MDKTALNILLVGDVESDAALIVRHLENGGYHVVFERVEDGNQMRHALKKADWHAVIADYRLPYFSALEALATLKETGRDIPFIIVSGAVGEETAVAMMKAGAHDYIMKNNLIRLVPAVERELREAESRRERIRVEEALVESESRFRLLFERAPLGYQSLDDNGCFIDVNQAWLDALGYRQEEVIGRWFGDFLTRASQDLFRQRFHKFKDTGEVRSAEFELVHKDGSTSLFSFNGRIVYDKQGRIIQTHCILTDIAERRRAEEALRESEAKYRQLFETESDALFLVDKGTGDILEVNTSTVQLYGYEREELLRMRNEDLSAEPEKTRFAINHDVTAIPIRWHRKKNGEVFPVEIVASYFQFRGKHVHMAAIRDVSQRIEAEKTLRESEERFRVAAENASDLIWEWNIPDKTLRWFGRIDELLGYKPGEFPRTIDAWEGIIHADDHDRVMEALDQHLKIQSSYCEEYRVRCKDGTIRYWIDKGAVFRDQRGNPYKMIGACADITARKRAEGAFHKEQNLVRAFMNNVSDHIYFKDINSRFIQVSKAMAEWFNLADPEQAVGKTDFDFFTEEHARQAFEDEQKIIRTGLPVVCIEEKETWAGHRDTWVSTTKMPLRDEKGNIIGTFGISRNITERKNQEIRIMADLKEKESLLKEIHHRVKNNLQVISSLLNLQMERLTDPRILSVFRESQNRIMSMSMVHEALYQSESLSEINFAEYIESFVRHLFSSYCADPERIELRIDAEPVLLEINKAVPCGLIVHELVSNALKHAFSPGRKKKGLLEMLLRRIGNDARLTVRDNGVGLPESASFVKSKSLGMRLVGILTEQLEGKLNVKRKPGTEISVTFPITETSK